MAASAVRKSDLTPKQEKVLGALLSHPTMEEAAEAAGVNRTTIFRWLQQEDFQAAYRDARRESVRHAIARLQNRTSEAVEVLAEVMNDETNTPSARVGAAKAIIEYSIKAVEVEDLAERLTVLEAMFKQQTEIKKQAGKKP